MVPNKTRVLVVEDSPGDFVMLLDMLAEGGKFELVHQDCLQGALRLLSEGGFDVVLLDLFLPENFGLETLRKVREADSRTPVIVWTGFYSPETASGALRMGAKSCFFKADVKADELSGALRGLVPTKLSAGGEEGI